MAVTRCQSSDVQKGIIPYVVSKCGTNPSGWKCQDGRGRFQLNRRENFQSTGSVTFEAMLSLLWHHLARDRMCVSAGDGMSDGVGSWTK